MKMIEITKEEYERLFQESPGLVVVSEVRVARGHPHYPHGKFITEHGDHISGETLLKYEALEGISKFYKRCFWKG